MYDTLTVYHGGTKIITEPKVNAGRPNLDFGPGLYVTDIYVQAKDWALKIGKDRGLASIVNVYHIKQKSRLGHTPWTGFDYIEGGVADDRVINTIRL